jgi:hypothetical protein
MSSLFDDLARTLATPMPRRGALRTIGAALAVAAVPALRPDRALGRAGRSQACVSPTKRCFVEIPFGTHEGGCYYPKLQQCCTGPNNDQEHPNNMSWVCPKDHTCGTAGTCTCTKKCADGSCCPSTKGRCVNGTCCPAIRTTRAVGRKNAVACCPPGTIAVPGEAGLCCPKGNPNCCEKYSSNEELTNLLPKGKLCVNGKLR